MLFKKVLVPVDFSEYSIRTLDLVIESFPDAEIIVLHVVELKTDPIFMGAVYDTLEHDSQEAALTRLTQMISRVSLGNKAVSPFVDIGKPAAKILENCKSLGVDLVALGSHGKDGLTKAFFGNTTYQVSRRVECAALIVR